MWDEHVKKVLDNGRKKVNRLRSNRDIDMSARRLLLMLLLAVVRPTVEYGSEVWEANKSQAAALESVMQSVCLGVHLGCLMRQSGVIWALIHYIQGHRDRSYGIS